MVSRLFILNRISNLIKKKMKLTHFCNSFNTINSKIVHNLIFDKEN